MTATPRATKTPIIPAYVAGFSLSNATTYLIRAGRVHRGELIDTLSSPRLKAPSSTPGCVDFCSDTMVVVVDEDRREIVEVAQAQPIVGQLRVRVSAWNAMEKMGLTLDDIVDVLSHPEYHGVYPHGDAALLKGNLAVAVDLRTQRISGVQRDEIVDGWRIPRHIVAACDRHGTDVADVAAICNGPGRDVDEDGIVRLHGADGQMRVAVNSAMRRVIRVLSADEVWGPPPPPSAHEPETFGEKVRRLDHQLARSAKRRGGPTTKDALESWDHDATYEDVPDSVGPWSLGLGARATIARLGMDLDDVITAAARPFIGAPTEDGHGQLRAANGVGVLVDGSTILRCVHPMAVLESAAAEAATVGVSLELPPTHLGDLALSSETRWRMVEFGISPAEIAAALSSAPVASAGRRVTYRTDRVQFEVQRGTTIAGLRRQIGPWVFSNHAEKRMVSRGIDIAVALKTLEEPQNVLEQHDVRGERLRYQLDDVQVLVEGDCVLTVLREAA